MTVYLVTTTMAVLSLAAPVLEQTTDSGDSDDWFAQSMYLSALGLLFLALQAVPLALRLV